jgi:hypothetical protein
MLSRNRRLDLLKKPTGALQPTTGGMRRAEGIAAGGGTPEGLRARDRKVRRREDVNRSQILD